MVRGDRRAHLDMHWMHVSEQYITNMLVDAQAIRSGPPRRMISHLPIQPLAAGRVARDAVSPLQLRPNQHPREFQKTHGDPEMPYLLSPLHLAEDASDDYTSQTDTESQAED